MIEKLIQALPQYKSGRLCYYQDGDNFFLYSPDGHGAFFDPRVALIFEAYRYVCFCTVKNDRVELVIY